MKGFFQRIHDSQSGTRKPTSNDPDEVYPVWRPPPKLEKEGRYPKLPPLSRPEPDEHQPRIRRTGERTSSRAPQASEPYHDLHMGSYGFNYATVPSSGRVAHSSGRQGASHARSHTIPNNSDYPGASKPYSNTDDRRAKNQSPVVIPTPQSSVEKVYKHAEGARPTPAKQPRSEHAPVTSTPLPELWIPPSQQASTSQIEDSNRHERKLADKPNNYRDKDGEKDDRDTGRAKQKYGEKDRYHEWGNGQGLERDGGREKYKDSRRHKEREREGGDERENRRLLDGENQKEGEVTRERDNSKETRDRGRHYGGENQPENERERHRERNRKDRRRERYANEDRAGDAHQKRERDGERDFNTDAERERQRSDAKESSRDRHRKRATGATDGDFGSRAQSKAKDKYNYLDRRRELGRETFPQDERTTKQAFSSREMLQAKVDDVDTSDSSPRKYAQYVPVSKSQRGERGDVPIITKRRPVHEPGKPPNVHPLQATFASGSSENQAVSTNVTPRAMPVYLPGKEAVSKQLPDITPGWSGSDTDGAKRNELRHRLKIAATGTKRETSRAPSLDLGYDSHPRNPENIKSDKKSGIKSKESKSLSSRWPFFKSKETNHPSDHRQDVDPSDLSTERFRNLQAGAQHVSICAGQGPPDPSTHKQYKPAATTAPKHNRVRVEDQVKSIQVSQYSQPSLPTHGHFDAGPLLPMSLTKQPYEDSPPFNMPSRNVLPTGSRPFFPGYHSDSTAQPFSQAPISVGKIPSRTSVLPVSGHHKFGSSASLDTRPNELQPASVSQQHLQRAPALATQPSYQSHQMTPPDPPVSSARLPPTFHETQSYSVLKTRAPENPPVPQPQPSYQSQSQQLDDLTKRPSGKHGVLSAPAPPHQPREERSKLHDGNGIGAPASSSFRFQDTARPPHDVSSISASSAMNGTNHDVGNSASWNNPMPSNFQRPSSITDRASRLEQSRGALKHDRGNKDSNDNQDFPSSSLLPTVVPSLIAEFEARSRHRTSVLQPNVGASIVRPSTAIGYGQSTGQKGVQLQMPRAAFPSASSGVDPLPPQAPWHVSRDTTVVPPPRPSTAMSSRLEGSKIQPLDIYSQPSFQQYARDADRFPDLITQSRSAGPVIPPQSLGIPNAKHTANIRLNSNLPGQERHLEIDTRRHDKTTDTLPESAEYVVPESHTRGASTPVSAVPASSETRNESKPILPIPIAPTQSDDHVRDSNIHDPGPSVITRPLHQSSSFETRTETKPAIFAAPSRSDERTRDLDLRDPGPTSNARPLHQPPSFETRTEGKLAIPTTTNRSDERVRDLDVHGPGSNTNTSNSRSLHQPTLEARTESKPAAPNTANHSDERVRDLDVRGPGSSAITPNIHRLHQLASSDTRAENKQTSLVPVVTNRSERVREDIHGPTTSSSRHLYQPSSSETRNEKKPTLVVHTTVNRSDERVQDLDTHGPGPSTIASSSRHLHFLSSETRSENKPSLLTPTVMNHSDRQDLDTHGPATSSSRHLYLPSSSEAREESKPALLAPIMTSHSDDRVQDFDIRGPGPSAKPSEPRIQEGTAAALLRSTTNQLQSQYVLDDTLGTKASGLRAEPLPQTGNYERLQRSSPPERVLTSLRSQQHTKEVVNDAQNKHYVASAFQPNVAVPLPSNPREFNDLDAGQIKTSAKDQAPQSFRPTIHHAKLAEVLSSPIHTYNPETLYPNTPRHTVPSNSTSAATNSQTHTYPARLHAQPSSSAPSHPKLRQSFSQIGPPIDNRSGGQPMTGTSQHSPSRGQMQYTDQHRTQTAANANRRPPSPTSKSSPQHTALQANSRIHDPPTPPRTTILPSNTTFPPEPHTQYPGPSITAAPPSAPDSRSTGHQPPTIPASQVTVHQNKTPSRHREPNKHSHKIQSNSQPSASHSQPKNHDHVSHKTHRGESSRARGTTDPGASTAEATRTTISLPPANPPQGTSTRHQQPVSVPSSTVSPSNYPPPSSRAYYNTPARTNVDTRSTNIPPQNVPTPSHQPALGSLIVPRTSEKISRVPSEESILKTPSSLAPSMALKPTVSRTSIPASLSSQTDSRRRGLLGMFRSKTVQPPSQSFEPQPPPVEHIPDHKELKAKEDISSRPSFDRDRNTKVTTTLSSRVKVPPPIALPIPITSASGRKSPNSKVFTPFRYLTSKRNRAVSAASVEAQDGTAPNTVVGSPTASMHSTQPPMHPPPLRDPFIATQEWRKQEAAEARELTGGKMRRQRPGVVFDVAEDPFEDQKRSKPTRLARV